MVRDETDDARSSPQFEIKTSRGDDATTIAVSGELDLASVDQLNTAIRTVEESDPEWIVIDLAELRFMDSTVLNALLEMRRRASQNRLRLDFVPSRHEQVSRVLAITETSEALFPAA